MIYTCLEWCKAYGVTQEIRAAGEYDEELADYQAGREKFELRNSDWEARFAYDVVRVSWVLWVLWSPPRSRMAP